MGELSPPARRFFRDQLRSARAAVLADSEAFPEILFAVERLGAFLVGRTDTLAAYKGRLIRLARESPLARQLPRHYPVGHLSFDRLFEIVQAGRNDAFHQGAAARHLTARSVELALVLEDALMNGQESVGDFMVRSPVCAEMWQPISVIRQHLLENSFSYLPVHVHGQPPSWRLISDRAIARFLRNSDQNLPRDKRLAMTLQEAEARQFLRLEEPKIARETEDVRKILEDSTSNLPVLIVDGQSRLAGIATPFDLL